VSGVDSAGKSFDVVGVDDVEAALVGHTQSVGGVPAIVA